MLFTYSSNRLENLVGALAEVVAVPPDRPLDPEVIVVQSRGMQRWLSMQLAGRLGIWANARFPFPNTMARELFAAYETELEERSRYEVAPLAWHLFERLPALLSRSAFSELNRYLEGAEDDYKRFQLVQRIARLFDQYVLFRPDLIASWESGKDGHWQAALWRDVSERLGPEHRAALHARMLQHLDQPPPEGRLPGRICIFGISALPPFHLDLFARMAEHLDIHAFLMNPSREHWGVIDDEKTALRRAGEAMDRGDDPEALHTDTANPLLGSMGRLGRDFLDLVLDYPAVESDDELFEDPGGDSLLHQLQSDIYHLRPGQPVDPDALDDSLRIHSCHSRTREVEVLRDALLEQLDAHPGLAPRDIVVMAPDIRQYTSAVQAVFGGEEWLTSGIPFTVADRSARETNGIAEALFGMLDLVESRFPVSAVLRLLDHAAVHKRFGLSESDLDRIGDWLVRTRVRWGLDGEQKKQLGLPDYEENTWSFVLDRMLLGYAMPAQQKQYFKDCLPFDDIEGGDARILGAFCAYFDLLRQADQSLRRDRSVDDWMRNLEFCLQRIAAEDTEHARSWEQLRRMLSRIGDDARLAGFTGPVSRRVIQHLLQDHFDNERGVSPYLGGGVTFCSLLPMRSIPFQVVCLLGMNERDYPRRDQPLGFDLIARHPRPGDRSRRNDDRYLFLEALLSARRAFHVSYLGRNQRDNAEMPPSVLVSELIDCLSPRDSDEALVLRKALVREHPLQPFSPRYFDGTSGWFSYSSTWSAAAGIARKQRPEEAFAFSLPPDPVSEVTLEELCNFFKNPARWFMAERLDMRLPMDEAVLDDRISEVLDSLERFQLKEEFLNLEQLKTSPEEALELVRLAGELPHGVMGELAGKELQREAIRFSRHLEHWLRDEPAAPLEVDALVAGLRLTGKLSAIQPGRRVLTRFGDIRAQDQLVAWIEHLAWCLSEPAGDPETLYLGWHQGALRHCTFSAAKGPNQAMAALLELYQRGRDTPLPFFPMTSLVYADRIHKAPRKTFGAEMAAAREWKGDAFRSGEFRRSAHFQLAWLEERSFHDPAFTKAAVTVFGPMLNHRSMRK